MNVCILICDASRARLFERVDDHPRHLRLLREFSHESSRLKASEIVSDRPGRLAKGRAMLPVDTPEAPKRAEAERFAHELAAVLHEKVTKNDHACFAIVAPPRFLGQLKKCLSSAVSDRLVATHNQDLTWAAEHELEHRLSDLFDMIAAAEARQA